ncbi:virulence factor [Streptococcus dentiloxodontae]
MGTLSRRKKRKLQAKGWDLEFVSYVQPKGNIDFRPDNYWLQGDGYHAELFVYNYPTQGLPIFWGRDLMQISGTRAFMSAYLADSDEIRKALSKAVEEKLARSSTSNKALEAFAEQDEIQDLMQQEQDVRRNNKAMWETYVRIYVSANTEKELFEKINQIKEHNSVYDMTVLVGEQDIEFEAPFIKPSDQHFWLPNRRQGIIIPSDELAGGYFFDHTRLLDPYGAYYGMTPTRGAINFDFLHRDEFRTRSLMLISGNPKMHQRKFVAKLSDDMFSRGHFIRNIDTDGSLKESTRLQHGIIVDMAGSENRINIFQIFPTVTTEDGGEVDERKSFNMHIDKLKSITSLLNPDITGDDLTTFAKLATQFYVDNEFWYDNPEIHLDELWATQYVNEDYPTLRDFENYLHGYKNKLEKTAASSAELVSVTRIYNTYNTLLRNKSNMYDGTTDFQDITQEQVVNFDFSGLDTDDFNVQVFSVLTLLSSHIINNAKIQKKAYQDARDEDPENTIEGQFPHYILNISGAQRIINPKYAVSVELLADIIDSMADNFAGITIFVNTLQSILMTNGGVNDPYTVAVRRIFNILLYRVFANTSEGDIPLLAETLSESMNPAELGRLSGLGQGELFMNISGTGNYVFQQENSFQFEQDRYRNIE